MKKKSKHSLDSLTIEIFGVVAESLLKIIEEEKLDKSEIIDTLKLWTEEGKKTEVKKKQKMIEPTFDRDGYPTEETLESIRQWPHTDFVGLINFAKEAWSHPERFILKDGIWIVSTGGWSGNEDIITALSENKMFWSCYWLESKRGGHYKFKVKGT